MAGKNRDPVLKKVLIEQNQTHETRKDIIVRLERELKRPVVSFFTSFKFPVMIENDDADMLEGILQTVNLAEGFVLVVNSPGGSGLAAERIINVCRSYSGKGDYSVIVPSKAKSAATMICLGSSKIIMGATSELGPIDPQVVITKKDGLQFFSVYNVINSYDNLFSRAVRTKGNLQPYLQQLANYDEREIKEFRSQLLLSEDIAVRTLASGMKKGVGKKRIKSDVQIFLTPKHKKVHGRPIYAEEAAKCGLNVEVIDVKADLWRLVHELYVRTNNFVNKKVSKCFESREYSYIAGIPK